MKPESNQSWMPAVITVFVLVDFSLMGGYILYKAVGTSGAENPKLFSLLDMIVVATLNFVSMCVGYWVGTTHASKAKDSMLWNSTPAPTPSAPAIVETTQTTQTTSKTDPNPPEERVP